MRRTYSAGEVGARVTPGKGAHAELITSIGTAIMRDRLARALVGTRPFQVPTARSLIGPQTYPDYNRAETQSGAERLAGRQFAGIRVG